MNKLAPIALLLTAGISAAQAAPAQNQNKQQCLALKNSQIADTS